MKAGPLRHLVTFQEKVKTRNPESGAVEYTWSDRWAGVYASVEPLSARDLLAAKAAQTELSARIVIRYREGVEPTMRIVHRGAIYAIVGKPLPDKKSGREYLTILVSEGLTDG
ncbi:phage head closure protein [Pseudomonas panipatensis]|uniref:Phage head-tail adaptor, putative, SPP1 family n=1 Tax=Pseudomonas panipatensis TaxID=428992 RepID=A0A1G8HKK2_9PSED|nr:phage head closure protein [Pseudomonas panipatensis]SDI07125.1 phage head-tail adaptor, putative, SPP1 family [Pseudomonas panipatensis]SMP58870.1 phage head-tail adaptor, putative, SPP1 family [Pseudomonas panipatensis]